MKMLPGAQPQTPQKVEGWQGYTIDQLRYRRAYVAARIELEREQLVQDIKDQRQTLFSPLGIIGHAGSLLKYANWGMIAFEGFKTITSLFRRKKK